jgi:uncharacterized membrane protein AbrB (regulator of aidB expression)
MNSVFWIWVVAMAIVTVAAMVLVKWFFKRSNEKRLKNVGKGYPLL